MRRSFTRLATVIVLIAILALTGASAYGSKPPAGGDTTIVRVYYPDRATGNKIIISFEAQLLETNYEQGYHVLEVTQQDIDRLVAAGLTVQVDETWTPPPERMAPSGPAWSRSPIIPAIARWKRPTPRHRPSPPPSGPGHVDRRGRLVAEDGGAGRL